MIDMSSPFIKIIDNSSPNTIVYFSSVDVPEGKFNGTSAVNSINANFVFVNCVDNNWYLLDIPGLSKNIVELASNIKQIINEFCVDIDDPSVTYFGGSMGGYGALICGCLNNANKVIATGVEINLTKVGGYAFSLSRADFSKVILPDVVNIVSSSNAMIELAFGENAPTDYQDIDQLSSLPNVNIFSIPNCGHKVPVLIEKTVGIKSLLENAIEGKSLLKVISGKLTNYPKVLNMLSGLIEFDCDYIVNLLTAQQDIDSLVKSQLYERLGSYFEGKSDVKSIDFYKLSVHFNPGFPGPYVCLAKLFLKRRNLWEFRRYSELAIATTGINKTDSVEYQFYLFAKGLSQLNRLEDALSIIDNKLNNIALSTPLGKLVNQLKGQLR